MITIQLRNNFGFSWHKNDRVYAKGYLFDENDNIYQGDTLVAFFANVDTSHAFKTKLEQSNGIFSVIIKKDDLIMMASDRSRTFPLFYAEKEGELIVSDHAEQVSAWSNYKSLDTNNVFEFMATGYVTAQNTLIKKVYQVQAGEMICGKPGRLDGTYYHFFIPDKNNNIPLDNIENNTASLLNLFFEKYIKLLNGRHVVLPLSGGYDSRLLAVLFKLYGYKNITCITYGKKDNYELAHSKHVADILGFKWMFIEYTPEMINNFLDDPFFQVYYRFAANFTSMFFMQEFFAVKHLKIQNLVPDDAVFVMGHSGDFVGGSHIPPNIEKVNSITKLAEKTFKSHYKESFLLGDTKNTLINNIRDQLKRYNERTPYYAALEDWDLKERQAKFIVNSCNVFNFFGYEFLLPLFDRRLLDYFQNLPLHLKKYKLLYNKVLNKYFFEKYDLNFKKELQPSITQIKLKQIKDQIKKYLPYTLKKKRLEKMAWNQYELITREMLKDMNAKGHKPHTNINTFNGFIIQWYIYNLLN
jgi:asparagine synthase (glutamine-hydrolysing)